MKKVSVIVPIYNVEEYLEKCLDSLVNQTLKEIEIILVNDGSPDNSEKIVKKYEDKYKDKIIYIKKENGGQATARNLGLTYATGEYITYVDSDDWIELDMFKTMYDTAKKKNADLVTCDSYIVNDGVKTVFSKNTDEKEIKKSFILNESGPWGKIIKKSILIDNKIHFPEIRAYEDIAIMPSLMLYSNVIVHISKPMYNYLIRAGSTMKQTKYSDKLEQIFFSLKYLEDTFIKEQKYIEYKTELEYLYIDHLLHAASLRFFVFDNYAKNIEKIVKIIKDKFPDWRKNKYYKKENIKYKVVCNLFYLQQYALLRLLLK